MPTVAVVLGPPHSGASVLAGILNALGYDLGQGVLQATPASEECRSWRHPQISRVRDRLLASLGSTWDDPRPLPDSWISRPPARPGRAAAGDRAELWTEEAGHRRRSSWQVESAATGHPQDRGEVQKDQHREAPNKTVSAEDASSR